MSGLLQPEYEPILPSKTACSTFPTIEDECSQGLEPRGHLQSLFVGEQQVRQVFVPSFRVIAYKPLTMISSSSKWGLHCHSAKNFHQHVKHSFSFHGWNSKSFWVHSGIAHYGVDKMVTTFCVRMWAHHVNGDLLDWTSDNRTDTNSAFSHFFYHWDRFCRRQPHSWTLETIKRFSSMLCLIVSIPRWSESFMVFHAHCASHGLNSMQLEVPTDGECFPAHTLKWEAGIHFLHRK